MPKFPIIISAIEQVDKIIDYIPLAAGEFGQTKGHLVGVRGYVGTHGGKRALDAAGSPVQAGVLGIDDTGEGMGNGVAGVSTEGRGVFGLSQNQAGVVGESTNFDGVYGVSHNPKAAGVSGHNPGGLAGWFGGNVNIDKGSLTTAYTGTFGPASSNITVRSAILRAKSDDNGGVGVAGEGTHPGNGVGVYGNGHWGVWGDTQFTDGVAIAGTTNVNNLSGFAGYFEGKVMVVGDLSVTGDLHSFRIDHPLDPKHKYLNHRYVESSERKNVYDGVVTLDNKGEATVPLPKWFEALNESFRYQLTCIGDFAQVYIAEEVKGNSFKIAGGQPGLKVSWQITGNRKDPWAQANPLVVEEDKSEREKGHYLFPEGYGADSKKSIATMLRPTLPKVEKEK